MKNNIQILLGAGMALASLLIILPLAPPAEAATAVCGKRAEVIKTLAQAYKEQPAAMGLAAGGGMLEVFSSQNGSWTILLTQPTGTSCIVAAGEGWESIPQSLADTST